jgi:hypothetical protein
MFSVVKGKRKAAFLPQQNEYNKLRWLTINTSLSQESFAKVPRACLQSDGFLNGATWLNDTTISGTEFAGTQERSFYWEMCPQMCSSFWEMCSRKTEQVQDAICAVSKVISLWLQHAGVSSVYGYGLDTSGHTVELR